MSFFAIGDIQGCYDGFRALLDRIHFNPELDTVWLAGDLVNRGPGSLDTLRFVRQHPAFKVVLGNHDLHLLAVAFGGASLKRKDTLRQVLDAPDADELLQWLAQQALMLTGQSFSGLSLAMTHAGIPPHWTIPKAQSLAAELETAIRAAAADPKSDHFLRHMYGNDADQWKEALEGNLRLQAIANYLTRMRFIDSDFRMDLNLKEDVDSAPSNLKPWFVYPRPDKVRILFGHWAALEGEAASTYAIALDAGYVWGGHMKAVNIDTITDNNDHVAIEVSAPMEQVPLK
ncbi:symmetrical bis(5'-nucleosyl)-tetraphosphatase [Allohahella sp. A8]|uniref:symmetrical bis(5'-nucleosyl)-tetraphosphatase n=1 Tax=Allohahella sp. A8 TaxID=3141461 RepID=UPI003A7FCA4F